jgi:ABC-type sugar transport system substrate-binding protein
VKRQGFRAGRLMAVTAPAVVAAVALTLVGCSSSGSSSSSSASSSSSPSSGGGSASASAASTTGKPQKIAFIQLQSSPLTSQVDLGANYAASQVNSTFTAQGPANLDPQTAVSALTSDVSAGYNGVIADAYPPELWSKPLANAKSAGIAVATLDTGAPGTAATFQVGASREGLGAALAEQFALALGKNAHGTIQPGICVPGLGTLVAVITGFTTEMKTLEPGVTVAAAFNSTGAPDTSYTAWSQIIQQEPNELAFFGVCDQDAASLIKVKSAHPSAKYLIGNVSGDDVADIQAVQSGLATALIGQNGFVQGYLAAKYMLAQLQGGAAMPTGWLSSGLEVITKSNAAAAIAVRNTNTAAGYVAYYASTISKAEAAAAAGGLPPVAAQLTTLSS